MSSWSDRIAVIRVRVLRLAMLAVTTVPALAQTPPPPAPGSQPNILRWPMPETVSPQGRALTTMMARAPVPDPLPPLVDQRRFADAVQASFGKTLSKRYAVEVRTSEIAGVPVHLQFGHQSRRSQACVFRYQGWPTVLELVPVAPRIV